MLSKYRIALLFWWVVVALPATAQVRVVRGYVVDALSGDSLADVHVMNQGQETGTVTDATGYFRLSVRSEDSLRFSSTGYRAQTVASTDRQLLIRLFPDTLLLPEIRVLANRVNMYRDTTEQPLRLPGVPHVENPVRVKPMTWSWGQENFSDDAPGVSTLGMAASLSGPISYFMGYERDQRKYEREQQTARMQQGYRQAVSDEQVRERLRRQFQLTDRQYDSLLVIFNQERVGLVNGANREEAAATIFWFISDALRTEE